MAMHIAEAAYVHEDVEAQSRSGMEGAQGLVVTSPVAQTKFDNFRYAGFRKSGDQVANLPIGVVAGRVEQCRCQFYLQRLGAFDQIDYRSGCDGRSGEKFGCGLGQGRVASAACEGMARNPGAAGAVRTAMILGLVFIETLALFTLVIIFVKV